MNTNKIYAESVAKEYAVKDESKVVALRKLDNRAKKPARVFAYAFGIVFTLVMGVGMCLSMNVIGGGSVAAKTIGIIVGILGIAGISVNFPIYKKILEKSKKKYSSDIIRLAREISEEE